MRADKARPEAAARDRGSAGPGRAARTGGRAVAPGAAKSRRVWRVVFRATAIRVGVPCRTSERPTTVAPPHIQHASRLHDAPLGCVGGIKDGATLVAANRRCLRGAIGQRHVFLLCNCPLTKCRRKFLRLKPCVRAVCSGAVAAEHRGHFGWA